MRTTRLLLLSMLILVEVSNYAICATPRIKDNPLLQKEIKLEIKCEPLSYFCRLLEASTGARISVKRDISDQNITIFAKEITPHEAMRQVALLYGYYWEVSGEPGKYRYTLYRPLKRVREAEELRNDEIRRKEMEFRNYIEEGIQLANSDDAAIQKAFDQDPIRTSEMVMFRETLQALGGFSQSQRNGIWDRIAQTPNGEIQIPYRDLPQSIQNYFRKATDDAHAKYPDHTPSLEGIENQSLIIARGGGYGSPQIMGLPLQSRLAFFGLTGMGGSAGLGNVLYNSNRPLDEYRLKMLQEKGVDTSSYKAPEINQYDDYIDSESKSKRIPVKFKDDDIDNPNRLHAHTFTDIMKAASEAYNIDIVADDYLCRRLNNRSRRSTFPEEFDEMVAEVSKEFQYGSTKDGRIIRLRNQNWYNDELYEVPRRLIDKWVAKKKDKGGADLEFFDLLEIAAALDNFQIEGLMNCRSDENRSSPFTWEVMRMSPHLDRMRLCATFSSSQMAIAFDSGLPMNLMTYDQQQFFANLLLSSRPDMTDEELWNCSFKLGNGVERREISMDEARMNEMSEPMTHVQYMIVFSYIFGPDDTQSFNFLHRFENVPIKK